MIGWPSCTVEVGDLWSRSVEVCTTRDILVSQTSNLTRSSVSDFNSRSLKDDHVISRHRDSIGVDLQ